MSKPTIVSFSGGKDSTAMLIRMLEIGERIDDIVFADTKMEFPIKSTPNSFDILPGHLQNIKRIIRDNGFEFIGILHTHPVPKGDEYAVEDFILSGKDSFWMHRICEHVRGIVALKEDEAQAIFWAFGRHIPLTLSKYGNGKSIIIKIKKEEFNNSKGNSHNVN